MTYLVQPRYTKRTELQRKATRKWGRAPWLNNLYVSGTVQMNLQLRCTQWHLSLFPLSIPLRHAVDVPMILRTPISLSCVNVASPSIKSTAVISISLLQISNPDLHVPQNPVNRSQILKEKEKNKKRLSCQKFREKEGVKLDRSWGRDAGSREG